MQCSDGEKEAFTPQVDSLKQERHEIAAACAILLSFKKETVSEYVPSSS